MPDPDLDIRGGGGVGEKRQTPKNFFLPFGPQFSLKISGGGGGAGREGHNTANANISILTYPSN